MRATIKVFLAAVTLGLGANQAMAGFLDFDSGPTSILAGDDASFLAEGVTFATGDIPDAVALNDIITFSNSDNAINVLAIPSFAISDSNLAFPSPTNSGKDVLMTFVDPNDINVSAPISTLSLSTDEQNEIGADTVRLLVLQSTGNPNEFTVVGVDEALDNDPNGTILTVDLGNTTFTHAIFQSTSNDFEGFDDLSFANNASPIPEPSSIAMIGAGLLLIGYRNGRKKTRA